MFVDKIKVGNSQIAGKIKVIMLLLSLLCSCA